MLQIKHSFMLVLICSGTIVSNTNSSRIVYSQEEMQKHKRHCKYAMSINPLNLKDSTYQMKRALLTISADDADYIPKVVGAGGIFYESNVHYQLMHNGVKVILHSYYDVQWLTDVIHGLKGHHEPQEEKCFYEILKYVPENGTMIELGSYWAYYSLWFASEISGARNYLIEPDPRRLEIGKKNFELNNKVGYFQRGFVGKMKDNEPDISGTECISIDDFIEKTGINHINILHSDIQGAEAEMLETTIRNLDIIDYFVISTHDVPTSHIPCLQFLRNHNFIILAEHTAYQSCSGDGLIVAKRNGVPGPEKIEIRIYP